MFGNYQGLPCFPQKNDFLFIEQICLFQALNQDSIVRKIRFRLSENFRTNLLTENSHMSRNVFGKFQGFRRFSRKIFL